MSNKRNFENLETIDGEYYQENISPYLITPEGINLLSNIFSTGGLKDLKQIVETFYSKNCFYAIKANTQFPGNGLGRSLDSISFDPISANKRLNELEEKLRFPTLAVTTPTNVRVYGIDEVNFYKKLSESLKN